MREQQRAMPIGWHLGIGAIALGLLIAPAPGVAKEKILRIVNSVGRTLDPHVARAQAGAFIQLNMYDNLYRYQANPPKQIPWLAKSHTRSNDGLTWEITIRDDVKFHDGSPLTAADVAYSFRRALALKKSVSSVFRLVLKPNKVTAPEKYKVKFVLDKPYAPFFSALPLISIVNPRVIKAHEAGGDWGKKWLSVSEAGSGAYKLVPGSFKSQRAIDLTYYPEHFKGWHDNPIKRVKLSYTREISTQVLSMMKGTSDTTDPRLPEEQARQLEKAKHAVIHRDPTMRLFLLTINNQSPPLDNVHVRRAISYAFNYDGYIKHVMKGVPKRSRLPIPNGLWGAPADVKGYRYDLDKARAELELAKKQGVDLSREIKFMTITGAEATVQAALLLQSDLRKIGIKLTLGSAPFYNMIGLARKKETSPDIWGHWVSTYFVDPDNWIGQMYHSDFHGTWKGSAWYKNPKVDGILAKARSTFDRGERDKLYKQAARVVVDDAAAVWIYDAVQIRGLSPRVKGYVFSPVGSGGELRTWSLE